MKKVWNKLMLAVAAFVVLVACEQTPEELVPATLSFQLNAEEIAEGDIREVEAGEQVVVSWSAQKGSVDMGSFKLSIDGSIISETQVLLEGDEKEAFAGAYTFTAPEVDATLPIVLELIDAEGNKTEASFQLKILAEPSVSIYEATLLYAPLEDRTSKTFYSANLNETYSYNDVNDSNDPISADIDFGYYYLENSDYSSLAGIADYPEGIYDLKNSQWSTYNKTLFARTDLFDEEFESITAFDEEKIADAYEINLVEDPAGKLTMIVEGDIIAFKTKADDADNSRFGLLRVLEITNGDGVEGKIKFEVKVIK